MCVAVSQRQDQIAVGCLDKRMRLFTMSEQQSGTKKHIYAATDWVGFDDDLPLVWPDDGNFTSSELLKLGALLIAHGAAAFKRRILDQLKRPHPSGTQMRSPPNGTVVGFRPRTD